MCRKFPSSTGQIQISFISLKFYFHQFFLKRKLVRGLAQCHMSPWKRLIPYLPWSQKMRLTHLHNTFPIMPRITSWAWGPKHVPPSVSSISHSAEQSKKQTLSGPMVPKLWKHRGLGPTPRGADSAGPGRGLEIWISNNSTLWSTNHALRITARNVCGMKKMTEGKSYPQGLQKWAIEKSR